MAAPEKRCYTVEDLQIILACGRETVYTLLKKNEFRWFRVGGSGGAYRISHKEISNYIDQLPKQKVDGWRGVSERFKHIHLNNNFSQTYDIISSVIQKQTDLWEHFWQDHNEEFLALEQRYQRHAMFVDTQGSLGKALYGCYPLHPVSTFILPRLSERVAQNERTLFTFLSADGTSTLPSALAKYDDHSFLSITPDVIYDYFEPLFKKEAYPFFPNRLKG
ncbi:MAG TPA: hypothetical protein DEP43_07280 [Ruminococcaceae bacterium]|nr:hypothetical protein [Oscillospiraceae bacterium]